MNKLNINTPIQIPYSHRKRVDVLVELIKQSDALNDHVVDSVDVELDLGSGVAVTETQLRGAARFEREALDQLMKVCTDTWEDVKLMIKLNLNLYNWIHFDFCLCSFLSYFFCLMPSAQANECSLLLQCIAKLDGSWRAHMSCYS